MTQCLRTLTTLMVDTLLVMEHFLLAASLKDSLLLTEKVLLDAKELLIYERRQKLAV